MVRCTIDFLLRLGSNKSCNLKYIGILIYMTLLEFMDVIVIEVLKNNAGRFIAVMLKIKNSLYHKSLVRYAWISYCWISLEHILFHTMLSECLQITNPTFKRKSISVKAKLFIVCKMKNAKRYEIVLLIHFAWILYLNLTEWCCFF